MAKQMTMQQVADALGLSRMTVSSVVNGLARKRGVKDETAARVRQYLDELGYVPSRSARQLRGHDCATVSILHCGSLYSHLVEAFNRLSNGLIDAHRTVEVVIAPTDDRHRGLQELVARGTPSLIWIQSKEQRAPQKELAGLMPLLSRFERVIMYNYIPGSPALEKKLDDAGIYRLIIDRDAAAVQVARFLAELGHTDVALPEAAESDVTDPNARDIGLFAAHGLTTCGCRPVDLPFAPTPVFCKILGENLARAVRERGVTAAWMYDDELAGYVLADVVARGVRVPEELSLIGFDGMPFGAAFAVPLTTVAVPVADMIEQVHQLLDGGEQQLSHCFAPQLLLRGSHARRA